MHLFLDWALLLVSILDPFNTILGRILLGHSSKKPPPLISNQICHLLPLESDQVPYQIKFLTFHLEYFITLASLQQETYRVSLAGILLPLLLEDFHSLLLGYKYPLALIVFGVDPSSMLRSSLFNSNDS